MADDRHAEELADRALHRLRDTIATGAVAPPAAVLRTHANRWLRARRATAGGLAAAAVATLAFGGTAVWQPAAAPPGPAASPPPAASPSVPIDQLDWTSVTITLPPAYGCPDGPVSFVPMAEYSAPRDFQRRWSAEAMGPGAGFPAVGLWPDESPAYGDLTGDGQPEAVLWARCFETGERPIAGDTLLVVTRDPDGTLTALGWVGPPEDVREPYQSRFLSSWVAGGRLLIDAAQLADTGSSLPGAHPPGEALSYRWDGERLVADGPAAEYPPLLPAHGGAGPPVRLGPVADGLGCPDAELRFTPDASMSLAVRPDLDFSWGGTALADGGTYRFRPNHYRQHLFDLDGSGERRLLVTIKCQPTGGGARTEGLAVFAPAGDGWQGVSVLPSPTEPGHHYLVEWRPAGRDVLVSWTFDDVACPDCDFESVTDRRYRWTGSELVPVSE
jgi:hypothetical protein